MYNALTHLWYNSEMVYTSLLRVLFELKSGCMGFAWLEYYADAIPALTMYATAGWSPVVGGLPARRIALAGNYSKKHCSDVTGRAQHNCRGGFAKNSNQANPI